MKQYLDLLSRALNDGEQTDDRTGVGTLSVFGHQMRFNLADGFPLVTTKKIHTKSVIHELLWFLSGNTNIRYLQENGVRIWDEWADENGDLGSVYGAQWRTWPSKSNGHIDQISNLLEQIRTNPTSRRLIVSAWNPDEIENMALPPCHTMWQVKILNGKMHMQLYQRSGDIFLGIPFNIASYALLLHMLAQVTGYEPGEFIHTIGDAHLYSNHIEQAKLQLSRTELPLPQLGLNPNIENLFDFKFEDIVIRNYEYHPHIKAEVAV